VPAPSLSNALTAAVVSLSCNASAPPIPGSRELVAVSKTSAQLRTSSVCLPDIRQYQGMVVGG